MPDDAVVSFDDAFAGRYEQDVSKTLGDFPLERDEFGAGYMLAALLPRFDLATIPHAPFVWSPYASSART